MKHPIFIWIVFSLLGLIVLAVAWWGWQKTGLGWQWLGQSCF